MEPDNQALWRAFGRRAVGKHNNIINYITHPCDPNRNLYIIADILHL